MKEWADGDRAIRSPSARSGCSGPTDAFVQRPRRPRAPSSVLRRAQEHRAERGNAQPHRGGASVPRQFLGLDMPVRVGWVLFNELAQTRNLHVQAAVERLEFQYLQKA